MAGVSISVQLKKRLCFFEELTLMLRTFTSDINYFHRPLNRLISDFNKNESKPDFIMLCSSMLDSGADFPEAWATAVSECCTLLNKDEKTKLIEYGKNIGKTDTEGQKQIFETYYSYFKSYEVKAKDDYNKYNRTVIASFFFMGCGLFILMI